MKRKGYRQYSDSTLMSLPKRKIIELLRVAEHNYFVTDEALDNSAKAGRELAEKLDKHARWNGVGKVFSEDWTCSNCGHTKGKGSGINFCGNCGAKMDGDTNDET